MVHSNPPINLGRNTVRGQTPDDKTNRANGEENNLGTATAGEVTEGRLELQLSLRTRNTRFKNLREFPLPKGGE